MPKYLLLGEPSPKSHGEAGHTPAVPEGALDLTVVPATRIERHRRTCGWAKFFGERARHLHLDGECERRGCLLRRWTAVHLSVVPERRRTLDPRRSHRTSGRDIDLSLDDRQSVVRECRDQVLAVRELVEVEHPGPEIHLAMSGLDSDRDSVRVIRLAVALREGDDGLTFAAAIALARRVLAPSPNPEGG